MGYCIENPSDFLCNGLFPVFKKRTDQGSEKGDKYPGNYEIYAKKQLKQLIRGIPDIAVNKVGIIIAFFFSEDKN